MIAVGMEPLEGTISGGKLWVSTGEDGEWIGALAWCELKDCR